MNQNIKIIPFPEIENAYVVISFRWKNPMDVKVKKNMSFLWANEHGGAEWEPECGPITMLYPCDKNDPDAKEHWFYPYYKGQGYWSQCAVDEECLQEMLLAGDYEYIFSVLEKWAGAAK